MKREAKGTQVTLELESQPFPSLFINGNEGIPQSGFSRDSLQVALQSWELGTSGPSKKPSLKGNRQT